MKILFLIPDFSRGGAQMHLARDANGLARLGHQVSVVAQGADGSMGVELAPGVELTCLMGRSSSPLTFWRFARLLRRQRPNVVVGWSIYANSFVALAQRLGLVKASLLVENIYPPRMFETISPIRRTFSRLLVSYLYGQATLVAGNSADIVDYLQNTVRPSPKAVRIRNPVDLEKLDDLAAQPAPLPERRPGTIVVVAAGRVQNLQKGFDTLLRALARLPANCDWTLWMVGDGEDVPMLRTLAGDLGITDRIVWCGMQSNPFPYYAAADLMVVPSRFEGFPNVLLEAMALGRATVSTDCLSGPRELTCGGVTGLLTPVDDVDALAEAMASLMADPSRRRSLGEAAATHVARTHAEPVVIAAFENHLNTAIRNASR